MTRPDQMQHRTIRNLLFWLQTGFMQDKIVFAGCNDAIKYKSNLVELLGELISLIDSADK